MKREINLENLDGHTIEIFIKFLNENHIALDSLDTVNISLPYKFLKAVSIEASFVDGYFNGLTKAQKDEVIKEVLKGNRNVEINMIGSEHAIVISTNISYTEAHFFTDSESSKDEEQQNKWIISISATPVSIQHFIEYLWRNGHFLSFNMQCSKSK